MSYEVEILDIPIKLTVPAGTDLLTVFRLAEVQIDAPCSGLGKCKKCLVEIVEDDSVRQVVACTYPVERNLKVRAIQREQSTEDKSGSLPQFFKNQTYSLSLDLGSTNLNLAISQEGHSAILYQLNGENPLKSFGADILNRLVFHEKHPEINMQKLFVNQVNEMISELLKITNLEKDQIKSLSICANTAMHHLFFGLPTEDLIKPPFLDERLQSFTLNAGDLGFILSDKTEVNSLPLIEGFIGSDTSACLAALPNDSKTRLVVDIGTNTEIVLLTEDHLYCCSAASGPAFEGGELSCGCRAMPGAIDHVFLEDDLIYSTIHHIEPIGICGSGLIDLIATLKNSHNLSSDGRFIEEGIYPLVNKKCIEKDKIKRLQITDSIYLSQKDIRSFQLAKAAIFAGIERLMLEAEISADEIAEVYVSGNFAQYVREESFKQIGLIPKELCDRLHFPGNMALLGTAEYTASLQKREELEKLLKKKRWINLSTDTSFQTLYLKAFAI